MGSSLLSDIAPRPQAPRTSFLTDGDGQGLPLALDDKKEQHVPRTPASTPVNADHTNRVTIDFDVYFDVDIEVGNSKVWEGKYDATAWGECSAIAVRQAQYSLERRLVSVCLAVCLTVCLIFLPLLGADGLAMSLVVYAGFAGDGEGL
ncbi:uncharacterized protein BDZ99DRAFT_152820 [Mytilinidion resinicola]|uniref:Uncharacterized protein n=1 Tax=Mytilinidion resinicola TaxID=574789 RepID=A0A6A6Y7D6_9PEZI|nr:uncharacterized protein BDZ99DRAFT_152820 [Mytilinidion resinicola]KAF2804443.1 hypothetical protein BDZ99DRAFT_152820 [Mytilinidion resinicola]